MSNKREGDLLIPFLAVISDAMAIELSFLTSYGLRFYSPLTRIFPVTKGFPPLEVYFWSSLVVIVIWLFIFRSFGLYGARRNVNLIDEFYALVKAVSIGMLVVMSATFFYRGFSYSRMVFVFIWVLSLVFLMLSRLWLFLFERNFHKRGKGLLNVAIAGSAKWGNLLFDKICQQPGLGFKMVGFIGDGGLLQKKARKLGEIEDIAEVVRKENLDLIVVALTERENLQLINLIKMCEGLNVEFLLVPDLLELMTSRLRVLEIDGIPLLRIKEIPLKGWGALLKRSFDVIFSFLCLVVLMPLSSVVALLVKLDSRGEVFYKQRRIGLDGKEFDVIKFRTMRADAEKKTGPIWARKDDPRVTRVGKWLRRLSIDELPQLVNVLKGDMSLVGPRPERPFFVEKFKTQIPKYLERHRVKSGMTGWAQVNGLRGQSPIEERTKYDIYYVENWSLAFDFKIILKTIWAVIKGENSY